MIELLLNYEASPWEAALIGAALLEGYELSGDKISPRLVELAGSVTEALKSIPESWLRELALEKFIKDTCTQPQIEKA